MYECPIKPNMNDKNEKRMKIDEAPVIFCEKKSFDFWWFLPKNPIIFDPFIKLSHSTKKIVLLEFKCTFRKRQRILVSWFQAELIVVPVALDFKSISYSVTYLKCFVDSHSHASSVSSWYLSVSRICFNDHLLSISAVWE